MEKNVGSADRIIRIIAGIAIIIIGVIYHSWWGLVGIVPIATAFMSWCPLYAPCNISTRKRKTAS